MSLVFCKTIESSECRFWSDIYTNSKYLLIVKPYNNAIETKDKIIIKIEKENYFLFQNKMIRNII